MSNFSDFPSGITNQMHQSKLDYNPLIIKPPDRNKTHGTITKHLVIDSRDRDYLKYPSSSRYRIEITEDLRDITSMELSLGQIPNTYYNISDKNNTFYISDINEKINGIEIPEGQYNNDSLIETLNGKYGNLFTDFNSKINFSRDPINLKLRMQSDHYFNFNLNYVKNDNCTPCNLNSIDTAIGFFNTVFQSKEFDLKYINVNIGDIQNLSKLSYNDYNLYKMDIKQNNVDFKKIFFIGDYFSLTDGPIEYKCRINDIQNFNTIIFETLDNSLDPTTLSGNIFNSIYKIISPNIFQLNSKPYVILKIAEAKLLNSTNASNNAYTIIPLRSTADSIINQSTTPVHGVIKYFNPPLGKMFYLDLEFLNYDGTEFNFRGQENMLLFIVSMLNQPGKYNNYVDTN
tara:strand:- start:8 stop:1210 length:1203 start_codon:yes stop_codon:yes gene_type:complete